MTEENQNQKSIALVIAAALVAVAMGIGLHQVGQGFATRSTQGISVTGSARVQATADKAVWPLTAEQLAPTQSLAISKVNSAVEAVTKYLNDGEYQLQVSSTDLFRPTLKKSLRMEILRVASSVIVLHEQSLFAQKMSILLQS